MAELATIARPYAEAVFRVAREAGQVSQWTYLLDGLAVAANTQEFQLLVADPKIDATQVVDLLLSVVKGAADVEQPARRFLEELADYRHLSVLPEIAVLFHGLCNAADNVQDTIIYSAFPIDDVKLAEIMPTLEKRFGKKLKPQVQIDKTLIGGICAVVGDETLDLSVRARLKQMKAALMS